MKSEPDQNLAEPPSRFSILRGFLASVPIREWFLFAFYLGFQYFQWNALLRICFTQGQHGIDGFISSLAMSTIFGLSLYSLNEAYKYTFCLSSLAMLIFSGRFELP